MYAGVVGATNCSTSVCLTTSSLIARDEGPLTWVQYYAEAGVELLIIIDDSHSVTVRLCYLLMIDWLFMIDFIMINLIDIDEIIADRWLMIDDLWFLWMILGEDTHTERLLFVLVRWLLLMLIVDVDAVFGIDVDCWCWCCVWYWCWLLMLLIVVADC